MSVITTVIFDVFETLVQDTTQQWEITFQGIIEQQGLGIDEQIFHQVWLEVGADFRSQRAQPGAPFRSYFDAWRHGFELAFSELGVRGDAEAAVRRVFQDLGNRQPYPEAPPALESVRDQWRTAILSNADDSFLYPVLDRLGLAFEAVLSSEAAGVYKPQARLFEEMLDRLLVDPSEVVYVGDRQLEDVHGPAQVGIHTIWINRRGEPANPQLPAPDFQITSLLELPGIISRPF